MLANALFDIPPVEDAADRSHKRLFLIVNFAGTLMLGVLVAFLLAFNEYLAASVYACYGVLSAGIYLWLRFTGKGYVQFLNTQLFLDQAVSAVVTIALGGFVQSGYVFAWALLSPLAAIVFVEPRKVWRWFALYLALMTLVLAFPAHANHIPHTFLIVLSCLNLGGVSIDAMLMLYHATNQLRAEQARSEELLLNILPKEIAAILKDERRVVADSFACASVLFADVVGFTPLSEKMEPHEVVHLLNEVFSHLDSIVDKYALEKIKTIGDCYMIASGVPRPRADHAEAIVQLGLDILEFSRQYAFQGRRIVFRIGINSGPLVAGVIGRKKFIYDVWGDAVNVASRMESHGSEDLVQITDQTYQLVKDAFVCEPRGTLHIKGKGEMRVWRAIERAPGHQARLHLDGERQPEPIS